MHQMGRVGPGPDRSAWSLILPDILRWVRKIAIGTWKLRVRGMLATLILCGLVAAALLPQGQRWRV